MLNQTSLESAETCNKSCRFYKSWRNLLNLCTVRKDPNLSEPSCYDSTYLGSSCRWDLTRAQIASLVLKKPKGSTSEPALDYQI